jgi:2-polyprenyl-3-methyl-5-hydroxy-6-metoxy-1,4-benzoquinol methylase
VDVTRANFTSVAGDAADLSRYAAASFDVVLSNSVIEHVETYERQAAMASEVQRVGRRFFVQTPNRWFPLEPHFLFPFFQFLPLEMRVLLLGRFDLGWHKRVRDKRAARAEVLSIRLMSGAELRRLFPGATMYRERFLGVTKSFVVYGGWDT